MEKHLVAVIICEMCIRDSSNTAVPRAAGCRPFLGHAALDLRSSFPDLLCQSSTRPTSSRTLPKRATLVSFSAPKAR